MDERIIGLMKQGYTQESAQEMIELMESPITRNNKIPCEVYSRVVGYFRPVSQWNPGKRSEFNERLEYRMNQYRGGCA